HHGGVPTSTAAAADLLYRMITPGLVSVAGWALLVRERRRSARSRSAHVSGDATHTGAASSLTATQPRLEEGRLDPTGSAQAVASPEEGPERLLRSP
ncbi:hypothetical protein, partial [Streptomyces fagopyri]